MLGVFRTPKNGKFIAYVANLTQYFMALPNFILINIHINTIRFPTINPSKSLLKTCFKAIDTIIANHTGSIRARDI